MLGPSEKPKDCDSTFTLNHGFKGYSLRRHLGDSPSFPVQSLLVLYLCCTLLNTPHSDKHFETKSVSVEKTSALNNNSFLPNRPQNVLPHTRLFSPLQRSQYFSLLMVNLIPHR